MLRKIQENGLRIDEVSPNTVPGSRFVGLFQQVKPE